jgi:predicted house-cleaning noncanonical NTP pyrophosphatase (MazG superfamily)
MNTGMSLREYKKNVFINCPFDEDYRPLLQALLFTISFCGFHPRIACEQSDSGKIRVNKIIDLIKESQYGIHDISRMERLAEGDLPRFNMPFELGLEFGCKCFASGRSNFKLKKCLVLEKEQYRYKQVLSDISGSDIKHHNLEPEKLVKAVRDWIVENIDVNQPSSKIIWLRYNEFLGLLKKRVNEEELSDEEIRDMPIPEFVKNITTWMNSA